LARSLAFFLLVFALFTFGCKKSPTETAETPSAAPRGSLELVFPYGSEKEKWINDVTGAFNRSGAKTQSGKTIFVRAMPIGSGETIDNILSGLLQAHLASPASALSIDQAASRFQFGKPRRPIQCVYPSQIDLFQSRQRGKSSR
jgi:Ca-activated chloride channel homolog